MSLDWSNLVFLVIGWILSRLGEYFSSRQSLSNAIAVARDTRRYEVGRESYKTAMAAINIGLDVAAQRRTPSPDEMHEMLNEFYDPLRDARINLGLPMTGEVTGELIDAIFAVPRAAEEGGDVRAAGERALVILHRHRDEITDAWHRILHGD